MKKKHKRELKLLVANGSAVVGAFLLKKGMEILLEKVFDKEPPEKPDEDEDTTWREALAWASLTGALAGVLKLVIRRVELDKVL